jgi:hypothetical protein
MAVVMIEPQPPIVRATTAPANEPRAAEALVPVHHGEASAVQAGVATQVRAIETLIERTVGPAPVPGLEIRVLKRAPRGVDDDRPATDQPREANASPQLEPAPAPPQPLDIAAVADKVYRLLQRRQRLERERKGRY